MAFPLMSVSWESRVIAPNKPIVGEKIFEIECLENLASYINVPEDIAIRYTFPYHWSLTGHRPIEPALGAESSMEILEYALSLLGKSSLEKKTKEKILNIIHSKAIAEKRSFLIHDIADIVAEYEA